MALFKDIQDFASVYPALESASWVMLQPIVERVEKSMLRDQILGSALFTLLDNEAQPFQNSAAPMSAPMDALYRAARPYIANMAAYQATPKLNTLFTSGGLTQVAVEKRAAMWATNQRRAQDLADAYTDLNTLIELLIAGEATDYSGWGTASPIGIEIRESLVPSMLMASRFIRLHGPWMLHQLRPAMREIQKGPVLGILGQTDYDSLLNTLHTAPSTLSADQKARLDFIQPAILHGALADQIVPLGLVVNENQVWSWQASSGGGQLSGGEKTADAGSKDGLIRHHANKAKKHLEELRNLVSPDDDGAGDRRVFDGNGPITMF